MRDGTKTMPKLNILVAIIQFDLKKLLFQLFSRFSKVSFRTDFLKSFQGSAEDLLVLWSGFREFIETHYH